MEQESAKDEMLITLTSDIVAAHVTNNTVAVSDLPVLIQNVYSALAGLSAALSLYPAAIAKRFKGKAPMPETKKASAPGGGETPLGLQSRFHV